ncbi:MAG: hypothetical protein GDA50_04590 [Alphaproteobacteria bacterium GM202ARS2]|nr:hypothetical protein [Alphaproteobacteria bacterium GM202ARS2]
MSDDLRDGILSLNTRQFGTVIELMVQLLKDYKNSENLEFDLYDPHTNEKIEVKSSRAYKKQTLKLSLDTLYEIIINNSNRKRLLKQKQALESDFNCNIQQVKIAYFDKLYYVLLFYDVIEIFMIYAKDIKKDTMIGYSDKQHRGNYGEGQFHITQKNYQHHKDNYFIQSMTYADIKAILLKRKNRKA